MTTVTSIALWAVRLTGPAQVVLGVLIWIGWGPPLVPLHMLTGVVFVLAVLVLAGTAAWAGLRRVPVVLSVALALVVPLFGIAQSRLLPGPAHWVVKLAHLLIGIGAMAVAARLARFTLARARRVPVLASERPAVGSRPR